MAFFSVTTQTFDLTGDNAIRAGKDEIYVLIVADANGPIAIPTSEWTVRCECRTPGAGGTKVGMAQPTVSILNSGNGGEIQMEFANADTAGKSLAGRYDIELVHTTGKVTAPFQGAINVVSEITTGATP